MAGLKHLRMLHSVASRLIGARSRSGAPPAHVVVRKLDRITVFDLTASYFTVIIPYERTATTELLAARWRTLEDHMIRRELYPIEEARELLGGISRNTIYHIMRTGELRSAVIGRRRFITCNCHCLLHQLHDDYRAAESGRGSVPRARA